jgi:enoyl-CoA hydratase
MTTQSAVPVIGDRISLRRDGHVLIATIQHPTNPMNVVDEQMHEQLRHLMAALRSERHARAILLRAEGKAFCAGGDFAWFEQLRTIEGIEALQHDAKAIIWDLLDVRAPIVCALNGHAMGLGASIALLCDAVVMADTAKLGDPHVKVGLVAGDGGTAIWPLVLGPTLAKRYLLTGDALGAAQCAQLGLVTDVCPAGDVGRVSRALCDVIAANPPLAVQYTKSAVNQHLKSALLTSFDIATQSELVTFLSDDHVEAVTAMKEKRPGTYGGR